MTRLAIVVLALALTGTAVASADFALKAGRKMDRKSMKLLTWAIEQGARHVCVQWAVEGYAPDGEPFGVAGQVCE